MNASRPRVVAVIQARMGSSRLPGKVLRLLGGRPVLGWVVRAAEEAEEIDAVVIATSKSEADDPVVAFAHDAGVEVFRGSEDDVLSRFAGAARETSADAVVRLTSDCPLLDPRLIDVVARWWRSDQRLQYVSTTLVRSLPRGLDVELITTAALLDLDARATGHDRIHVTSAAYAVGSEIPRAGVVFEPRADDLRVTLDQLEDAHLLEQLVAKLGDKPPRHEDLVHALRHAPDLVAINAHVRQKALSEG